MIGFELFILCCMPNICTLNQTRPFKLFENFIYVRSLNTFHIWNLNYYSKIGYWARSKFRHVHRALGNKLAHPSLPLHGSSGNMLYECIGTLICGLKTQQRNLNVTILVYFEFLCLLNTTQKHWLRFSIMFVVLFWIRCTC